MPSQVTLTVNDSPIKVEEFVQSFLEHTAVGMVDSLKNTGPVKELVLAIEGQAVTLSLNGKPLPANPFVQKIIRSTTLGMVASLKGVGVVERLRLSVVR